jgi:hypothetical protein
MKKIIFIVLTFNLLGSIAIAQNLFPLLGGQRVGTAAATFLKIDVGADAAAMSGAYVAMANDATTLYWNPAAAAQVEGNSLTLSHIQWPVDIQYEYLGYVHHLEGLGTIGISLGMLHMPDMEVTTEYYPTGNGEYFRYYDVFGALTLSMKLTNQFSFGTTIKYIEEGLADLKMGGWMVDIGTFYWTGFKSLRFAVSLSNFGPDMKPEGSYKTETIDGISNSENYEPFSPPTTFRVGTAMEVIETERYTLTSSFQINHPVDNAENAVIGFDFSFIKRLHLRAGYKINYDEEKFTIGTGINIPISSTNLAVDYAYKSFTNLGSTHQFTIDFQF